MRLSEDVRKNNGDTCKRCRAPIVWATTAGKGRPIPVDPDPLYGGNVMLDVDAVGMLQARVVRPAGDIEGFVAHFVSCPNGEELRRPDDPPAPADQVASPGDAKRKALAMRMPFGKYSGQTLEEIDRDKRGHGYLVWAYRNLDFRTEELRRAIGLVSGEES